MTTAPTVKLQNVADINPAIGKRLPPGEEVDFIPMAGVDETLVDVCSTETRLSDSVSAGYTYFQDGDVLVAKITPCFENGKIAIANLERQHGFGSTEFHVVRPANGLNGRYLVHFLRRPRLRKEGELRMTGSGGQRRVPRHFLEQLDIPLPPLDEQQRIVTILDATDALRQQRRQALVSLDQLVQSLFIEMFGSPEKNPKKWAITTIGEMLESASYGTSAKAGAEGSMAVLRMSNLTYDGKMDLRDLKYIDLGDNEVDRFTVRSGDILFNRTNSPDLVGKTAVYRGEEPMAYAGYLVRLRTNRDALPDYISGFLNSRYGKAVLRGMCKSIIGMANINATEVQTIKIPKPPIELQSDFAKRIAAIEKNRRAFEESETGLAALFGSLQQRAFSGEL